MVAGRVFSTANTLSTLTLYPPGRQPDTCPGECVNSGRVAGQIKMYRGNGRLQRESRYIWHTILLGPKNDRQHYALCTSISFTYVTVSMNNAARLAVVVVVLISFRVRPLLSLGLTVLVKE